jgi:hypothetical protein
MHAVLITFTTTTPPRQLVEPFTEYADALKAVDGLVSKTWLQDGNILGGFHVFTTRAAADTYLGSEMVSGLTANPAFDGFAIRHFDILDGLSAITGSPQARQAATP